MGGNHPIEVHHGWHSQESFEESFQAGKGRVGLDQHQVRRWTSWHRFTTLALAALASLAICAAEARHDQPDLIRLTVNAEAHLSLPHHFG